MSKNSELVRFRILRSNAENQQIRLLFLPSVFERHRKNISFFYMKEKQIFWNFDVFVLDFEAKTRYLFTLDPTCERMRLKDALKILPWKEPELLKLFSPHLGFFEGEESPSFGVYLKTLEDDHLPRFISKDPSLEIAETLKGSCFQEYPELFIDPRPTATEPNEEDIQASLKFKTVQLSPPLEEIE